MEYNETLNYIHSLGAFSHKAGLDRIGDVCNKLNNPQNDFKAIHIAGTNGKGSVSTFISSALKEAGYRVGTFVSPYITDFCERIQINGTYIDRDDLCRLSQRVIDTGVELTEFEFITAVGFLYFSENKIDVAVLEVGLGGRFDATNIISSPLASVITKIGLDHTAILGDTIQCIAKEKCGIIKENVVVTTHAQPQEALDVIKSCSKALILSNKKELKTTKLSVFGNEFLYKNVAYKTVMGGKHQIENALIAIETLGCCRLKITDEHIRQGIAKAFIPARIEVVSKRPLVVIDGAHNPDGAGVLCDVIKEHKNVTAIIGVMQDKNYDALLSKTLPFCKKVVCVTPNVPRALSADELAVTAKKYCKNVLVASDLNEAVREIDDNPTFIFGSLYLASEIRPILRA